MASGKDTSPVVIQGLACQVPALFCPQDRAMELSRQFIREKDTPAATKIAERYYGTRIAKRHFVMLQEGFPPAESRFALYQDDQGLPLPPPTTRERMAVYSREAPGLATRSAQAALTGANCAAAAVTHLITVSCTGFEAPGFEFDLIETCGLRPDIGRLHVGFMGCHGAFNALRAAQAIARSEPGSIILIVSVELCSLHMQYGSRPEDLVANSLFADGAGACVISSARAGDEGKPVLNEFLSYVIPGSKKLMGWHIFDHGFVMDLNRDIPKSIYRHLPDLIRSWLHGKCAMQPAQVGARGIHPGGPRIVEAAIESLSLPAEAAAVSFEVLKEYGNMSSSTVFFLLAEMTRRNLPRPWLMIGFGPGLCVEAVLIG